MILFLIMNKKNKIIEKEYIYILFLTFFIIISNIIWLQKDTTPQRWDESIHLNAASNFTQTLKTNPLKVLITFITQESFYPPLVPFLAAFCGLIYPEQDSFTYIMILFQIILIIFTFLFTKKFLDIYSAICASTIIISFPLIYTEGHYFMFDLPLTSFIIMAVYFLFKTDFFSNRKYSFIFFIVCGAGMLIKWNFILFIITPFLFCLFQNKKDISKEQKYNIISGLIIFLIIILPWYFYNISTILTSLLGYSFKRGAIEKLPKILSMESFVFYLKLLPGLITLPFFILFLISIFFILKNKDKIDLFYYILIPLIIFTFLHNKKDRYIMPLLPFIAISISYLILIIKNKIYKQLLLIAIILFALTNYIMATYNIPVNWEYANKPQNKNWYIQEFLDKIEKDKEVTLAIVPDHQYMNNALYSFYTKNFYKNIKIIGIFNFPMFTDYFLIKTGDLGPFFSGLEKRQKILNEILDSASYLSHLYEKIYEVDLPDNTKGILYKLKSDIKINYEEYLSKICQNKNLLLNLYLKNAENFSFSIFDSGKNDFIIDKIIVEFKEAVAGDFKHKDIGLKLNNVKVEIKNIFLNPYLLNKNKLEILKLNNIIIKSLEINSEDLKNFVKEYAKDIEIQNITFKDNFINISGIYKNIPLYLSFNLYNPNPYKDCSDIYFKIKKLKIGIIPIPSFLVNFLLKDFNPLLVKSNSFIKVNFGEIKTRDNMLIVQ